MTRIFGYRLSVEMLLLWLIESAICFVVLLWLLGGDAAALADPTAAARARDDAAVLALTIGVVGSAIGLYRPETCLETRRLLLKATVAAAASLPAIWLVGKLIGIQLGALFDWNSAWPLQMLLAWTALLLATRLAFGQAVRMGLFTRRILLLGGPAGAARIAAAIAGAPRGQFRIAATADSLPPDVSPRRIWGVVMAADAAAALPPATATACRARGLAVLSEPMFWERHLGRIDPETAEAAPVGLAPRGVAMAAVSRVLDIAAAGALLLLTAPLMLVTALAIKVESPGPIFYRQPRLGLGGQTFTLVKFRSMRSDAEANGPVWAARRDNRVTRVGSFIRLVRIDELPQLICIIAGQMSLIGPRPERPVFVEQLAAAIPGYRQRLCVRPGLTGWAQVNFPYGASVEDARAKLSYDLYYVKHRSLMLDLMILLATVRVVLFQEGAR